MKENMIQAVNYRNTLREKMNAGEITYDVYERKLEIMCERLDVDLWDVRNAA